MKLRSKIFLGFIIIAIGFVGTAWTSSPAVAEMAPEDRKLFDAVRSNQMGAVKRSLLKGADVGAENTFGLTAIDLAIDKGYFPIAHYLLAWRKQKQDRIKAEAPASPPPPPAPQEPTAKPIQQAVADPIIPSLRIDPDPGAPTSAPKTVPVKQLFEKPVETAKPSPAPVLAPVKKAQPRPEPPPVRQPEPKPEIAQATAEPKIPEPDKQTVFQVPPPEPETVPVAAPARKTVSRLQETSEKPDSGPGVFDRIADLFKSEPQEPAAKNIESPTPPPEPAPVQQAATPDPPPAPAPTETSEKPDSGPGVFDRIAELFKSEPEKPAAKNIESPAPPPEPALVQQAATPDPPPVPAPTETSEKPDSGPGVFDRIAELFKSEPQEPAAKNIESPAPPPEPEIKAEVQPAEPVLKPDKAAEEIPETILGSISDFLSSSSEPEPKPLTEEQETALLQSYRSGRSDRTGQGKAPAPVEAAIVRTLTYDPYLVQKTALGKKRDEKSADACVQKQASKNFFCIEPVLWPKEIGDAFEVHTTLYRGRMAIAQYESGKATQFHILFAHGNYDAVVDFFTRRFGEPSQKPEIQAIIIGGANRKNRTLRWLGPKDRNGAVTILEVREIDDLRWSAPPDIRHGVARLYRKGQEPVFRNVSWSDFLLARMGRK
ncbi:MAG: hypothetical protein HQ512_06950 [Rhodospirillales bacterium]|nr:hypothetical protein [Rhodospirillales bacterium]